MTLAAQVHLPNGQSEQALAPAADILVSAPLQFKDRPPRSSQPPLWRSRSFQTVSVGLLVLTIFRLWYATRLELVGDEAYYWVQSRHLDICYFDKGPAVAWTIAAGRALWGNTVFGIRFFAVLLSAGTCVWLFILARLLFSDRVALVTVALSAIVPMFAVGSILMTIDPLSMFFWTLAAGAFWKAKDVESVGWWLLTGFCIGLGMLAKYTNAAELVSFALFCAWWQPGRQHLSRRTFGSMVLVTALVSLPLWIWNGRHGWVTLHHLAERGDLEHGWHLHPFELLTFFGGQAGVISPLLFAGIMAAVVSSFKTRTRSPATCFLLCLFLPLFVGYSVVSANHSAQPNWTAPCYLTGLILLASWWPTWSASHPQWRWLQVPAIAIALLETMALHETAWLHLPPGKDPLDRARGWSDLARQVASIQHQEGANFMVARNYTTASLLSFYLPGTPFVYLPSTTEVSNQFSIWPGYKGHESGRVALYVSETRMAPRSLSTDFTQVRSIGTIFPRAANRLLPGFHLFVCRDLRSSGRLGATAGSVAH